MTDAKVAAAGKEKMLTLRSSDGHEFEVSEAEAMESQTIKNMIDEGCADNGIPLPNVSSEILSKVIVFCKKHVEARAADAEDGEASSEPKKTAVDDLKTFDAEFVNVDQATLFDLMMAANYLDIKALLDLTCQTVANMMKGKTPDQIRATFNIKNDYTADEEEEVRRENQWAFE